MPGVGDYNLRSFFRALGIKNPQPSVRETIQPVIIAGDMTDIVPQYRPPSAVFGGDVIAVAAEFSFFQMTSRAEGGTLVHEFGADSDLLFQTINPALPATINPDFPLAAQLSVEPPTSLISTGSVNPLPTNVALLPNNSAASRFPQSAMSKPMWIRPGDTIVMLRPAANGAVADFFIWLTDLPASENSIL